MTHDSTAARLLALGVEEPDRVAIHLLRSDAKGALLDEAVTRRQQFMSNGVRQLQRIASANPEAPPNPEANPNPAPAGTDKPTFDTLPPDERHGVLGVPGVPGFGDPLWAMGGVVPGPAAAPASGDERARRHDEQHAYGRGPHCSTPSSE